MSEQTLPLIDDRPDWLHPLPMQPVELEQAFSDLIKTTRHSERPISVCRQCLTDRMEHAIVDAGLKARDGTCPPPETFAQIFYEHPNCVGGIETIKLFLPHGLKMCLVGPPPPGFGTYPPEVLETLLRSGLWYWPDAILTSVRGIAARLFHDWFARGICDLPGWTEEEAAKAGLCGPGDDILQLCMVSLIDPDDLIRCLASLHTPWADDVLSAAGTFIPEAPFYVAEDSGPGPQSYRDACAQIAEVLQRREACAFLREVTSDWLQAAFFRQEKNYPSLAMDLSELQYYYQVSTVDLMSKAQTQPPLEWPDLPEV